MATEDEIITFVAASLNSVWALELLLLLKREPEKSWPADALIRELRSSSVVVVDALTTLRRNGFATEESDGRYRYQAASPELDQLVTRLEAIYVAKPMTVIKAIVAAPNDKLRIFSDAFKLKDLTKD